MKIMITGAEGQLGTALRDILAASRIHTMAPLTRRDLDITDFARVQHTIETIKPDVVVNAAAYNFVDKAETERDLALSINKTGPENLSKAAFEARIPVLHVSTDYVFDGGLRRPYLESDDPNPISYYGETKLEGEKAVISNNFHSYIVRTAWVFGRVGKNFALTMLSLKDQPEIKVVNDQIGSPTYAPHLAQGILNLVEKKAPFGLYHMAGQGQASWFDFAKEIFQRADIGKPLQPISSAQYSYVAKRPRYTALGTERGREFLLPHWKDGVKAFIHGM